MRPAYQGSNPISDVWSLQALRMVAKYLVRAVKDTSDDEARAAMLLAAGGVPAMAQEGVTRVPVVVSESGCEPAAISVPAGPVVFEITNFGGWRAYRESLT